MKKKTKENTLSKPSAEVRDGIYAENNAEVSNPQPGEEKGFDAESTDKKAEEFEALIEGKYKEQFSEKVQKIISKRLKEVKEMRAEADKNAEIAQLVMKKFNMEDTDVKKLEGMIDEMMKQAENTKGTEQMLPADLVRRLIRENSLLKHDRETRMRDMETRSVAERIKTQVEETKQTYPDFDFHREVENPEFRRLIKAGVSVKNAYEVINIENILDNNSKNAQKQVVDSIRYKGNRPVENGSESTGGILLSNNVSKLSKKQRAELAKRAALGEKIEF